MGTDGGVGSTIVGRGKHSTLSRSKGSPLHSLISLRSQNHLWELGTEWKATMVGRLSCGGILRGGSLGISLPG